MAARRKSRFDKLFPEQATKVVEDALRLRSTIIQAKTHLVPFNTQYSALHQMTEAIDAALPLVAGKPIDYRCSNLGLLPVAQGGGPRQGRKD